MEIKKTNHEGTVTLSLSGRLDTLTSGRLGEEIEKVFQEGKANLILDFETLDYISSAGLRILLMAQKKVNETGTEMIIINTNENVREVFEMTGFTSILNIK